MDTTPKDRNKNPDDLKPDSPNRTRRAIFVFGGTILFTGLAAFTTLTMEGRLPELFVQGSLGIVELIVISYLFTTTIDRSEVLTRIGKGVEGMGERRRYNPRYDYDNQQDRPFQEPAYHRQEQYYQHDEDTKG
jgi:hypothetical protein